MKESQFNFKAGLLNKTAADLVYSLRNELNLKIAEKNRYREDLEFKSASVDFLRRVLATVKYKLMTFKQQTQLKELEELLRDTVLFLALSDLVMRGSNRSNMNPSMVMTADNNGVQVSHDILKVFFPRPMTMNL